MAEVSVIVPVFNSEKYLVRCLESLVHQNYPDFEVILVDDGSTDSSGAICDEYAKNNNIIVIHKENEGVARARNAGLAIASGRYVIFVDSDDCVRPDAISHLYKEAERSAADLVIGDVFLIDNGKATHSHFYQKAFITDDYGQKIELIKAVFYKKYCPSPYNGKVAFGYGGPWNKLVKKEVLTKNQIEFNPNLKGVFDDIIYSAYILMCSKRIAYIPVPVYDYYLNSASVTHKYKGDILEINEEIFKAWNEFIDKSGERKAFEDPYYANVLRRLAESLELYFFNPKYKGKRTEAFREINEVIIRKPYKDIPYRIDSNRLTQYHRALAAGVKHRSPLLLFAAFYGRKYIKRALRL